MTLRTAFGLAWRVSSGSFWAAHTRAVAVVSFGHGRGQLHVIIVARLQCPHPAPQKCSSLDCVSIARLRTAVDSVWRVSMGSLCALHINFVRAVAVRELRPREQTTQRHHRCSLEGSVPAPPTSVCQHLRTVATFDSACHGGAHPGPRPASRSTHQCQKLWLQQPANSPRSSLERRSEGLLPMAVILCELFAEN